MGQDRGEGWGGLDLASEVSKKGGVCQRDWAVLFGELARSEAFQRMWGRHAFKLDSRLEMAVGAFVMDDLKRHAHDYPYFYAGIGTLVDGGGWMMAKFDKTAKIDNRPDCMQADEVEEQLSRGTVALNSAGFFIQPLAVICAALLEALNLPIWLNVYITAKGRTSSAPPHTDKQDVIAIQTQGSKRFRIFNPPPTADKVAADPYTRGKGQDTMSVEELGEPLVDTVLAPGEFLYVPAGFPHTTDTLNGIETTETSVHLTLGVDTHVWDLNYACMRATALKRAAENTLVEGTFDINKLPADVWAELHQPLPLGFAGAALLKGMEGSGCREQRCAEAEGLMAQHMALELANKMLLAEPKRWGAYDAEGLVAKLELLETSKRYLEHYQNVMRIFRRVYADACFQLRKINTSFERAQPYLEELTLEMESLAAWGERSDAAKAPPSSASGQTKAKAPEAGKGMGAGRGMGMGAKAKAKGKKK